MLCKPSSQLLQILLQLISEGHLEKQLRLCRPQHLNAQYPQCSCRMQYFQLTNRKNLSTLLHFERTECCCVDMTELCFCFPTQALMFPNQLYEVVFEEELSTTNISIRLYGGALLSKSSLIKRWPDYKCIELFMLPHAQLQHSEYTAAIHEGVHSLC